MNEMKSFFSTHLMDSDPDLHNAIDLELNRQRDGIELIASENIVSRAVLEAQGSVLTNKYAEAVGSWLLRWLRISIWPNSWPSNASRSFITANGQTFSRIPVPMPIRASSWRCCSRVTRSSACPCCRRSPDPWCCAEPFRQMVQCHSVRRPSGRCAYRFR